MLQHPVRAGEDGCTLCISASLNPFKFKVPFINFTILMREKNPKEINNYSFYYLLKIVFVLSERMKIKRHEVFQLISICCNIYIYNYAWCTFKKIHDSHRISGQHCKSTKLHVLSIYVVTRLR